MLPARRILLLPGLLLLGIAGVHAEPAADLRLQVRDFAAGPAFAPVSLQKETRGGYALYSAEAGDLGLALAVEVTTAAGRLDVDCVVQDRRGTDRALTVRCGVPLDAVGWQWWDDLGTSRAVQAGKTYDRVQSWGGLRDISVYPFCAVTSKARGIGLAVDLDDPRVYRFRYDAGEHVLWIEVDLGIAAAGVPLPGQAAFSFLRFEFPPAWGFRSALQRYYSLFPEFARRRAPDDGIWLLGFQPGAMANPWDFGLEFDEGAQSHAGYDVAHGIEPYVYTEPWGKYEHFGSRPTPDGKPRYGETAPLLPAVELRDAILSDLAAPAGVSDKHFGARRSEVARALANSAITGGDGRWVFRHWTDEWSKGDWLSNVTCNPDPDLPRPNRASLAWDAELWPAFRAAEANGGALKGIYLDSVASFMGFDNESFRRDHWRHADVPLVASEAAKGPAQLHAFACVEFAHQVAGEMWSRGLLVTANTFRPHMQYFAHLVDMIGAGETSSCGLADDEHYRYLRTYAGTKPVSWMDYSFVNPRVPWEQKERGLKRCLFYAVHPGTGSFDRQDTFEPSRPLFRRYEPLIIRLGQAGWQPVTGARTRTAAGGASPVLVERYGSEPDSIYLTLRNPTGAAQRGQLSLSIPAGLASAGDLVVWNALAQRPVKPVRAPAGGQVVVPLALAVDDTSVLRLATRRRLLKDALQDAATWLKRFRAEVQWIGRASGGLLTNGGFEDGANGWGLDQTAGRKAPATIVEEGALSGKRSLRVTSEGVDAFGAIHQDVGLRGGQEHVLSFTYRWVRPAGATGTVVPRFGVKDAAGQWLSSDYIHLTDLAPTDGKVAHFEREVTPTAATAGGFFQILCSGTFGTFEVDDVAVRTVQSRTPKEAADAALAALDRSGAQKRLQAALAAGSPAQALLPASGAVAGLLGASQDVGKQPGDAHTRRCLVLPLQAAALAASEAVEIASGLTLDEPLFPAVVAGETARLSVSLRNGGRTPIQGWRIRPVGPGATVARKGPVAPGAASTLQVPVPVPAESAWGWHDALLAADVPAGKETLHLLARVTARPRPALSLAPVTGVVSSLDGRLALRATNLSALLARGRLRLDVTGPKGTLTAGEWEMQVGAGKAMEVPLLMPTAASSSGSLRAKATWRVGERVASWEGDVLRVPGARCPLVATPPVVDGSLGDAAWRRASELSPFVLNTSPKAPAKRTVAGVCRDAGRLYVAFACYGPTGSLVAKHNTRDGELWADDAVEVFVDPSGKRQEYYHLVVNAAGARYDARCGPGGIQAAWNGEWSARVGKRADAWTAEIAIPFATLGARPAGAWAMNLARDDPSTGEASVWACTYGGFHTPARFGELQLGAPASVR